MTPESVVLFPDIMRAKVDDSDSDSDDSSDESDERNDDKEQGEEMKNVVIVQNPKV